MIFIWDFWQGFMSSFIVSNAKDIVYTAYFIRFCGHWSDFNADSNFAPLPYITRFELA